ncbi:MAG: hypothetical protein ACRYFS_12720 [Janthinobacterium lividum]
MNFTRMIGGLAVAAALLSVGAAQAQAPMPGMKNMAEKSRYGGPVYSGAPALAVTSSLVKAGGGPANFSTATALTSMVGPKLVTAEVGKLTKQYGKASVGSWLTVFDFAVADSLKIATAAGVKLPPATLSGHKLASTLVGAGADSTGTFYTEFLLDKAVTHKIHMQVMEDIDAKYGEPADKNYHRVTNQAMVDVAHALGAKSVKVASLH